MDKIIAIGSACKDIFFPTSEGVSIDTPEDLLSQKKIQFELGAKYKIENRYEVLGGCAANVAVGLARLGNGVTCYAHIGNDHVADWIVAELKKNQVGTNLITRDQEFCSDMSAIIVDNYSAERVIFSNQKANSKLEIIPDLIKSAEWFFIGDLHGDWQAHLDVIFSIAGENKIKLAYNPRQVNIRDDVQKVIEKIAEVEIIFLNKDEVIEIVSQNGDFTVHELNDEIFLLQRVLEIGAKVVVLTDGVRGAWASNGQETFFVEGRHVPAVDSTGAGDAFASGFLGGYLKNKRIEECLGWGILNSSHEVQFYGSIDGLLHEAEILSQMKEVKIKKLA